MPRWAHLLPDYCVSQATTKRPVHPFQQYALVSNTGAPCPLLELASQSGASKARAMASNLLCHPRF